MGLADLIQSKSTERDQDKWDVAVLKGDSEETRVVGAVYGIITEPDAPVL